MAKVPPRTISSDDLVVTVDGVEYRPHEGESITVRGQASWQLLADTTQMFGLYKRIGDLDPTEQRLAAESSDRLFAELARLIISWTWTDDDGEPMPDPSPEVLRSCTLDEFQWLLAAVQPQAAEKNS